MLSDAGVSDDAASEPPATATTPAHRVRRLLLVLIVIAAAIFVRAQILERRTVVHASDGGGPLTAGSGRLGVSFPVELGRPFTFGSMSLHNEGKRPVVLDAIRLLPPLPTGFRLVDVVVAQDRDRRLNSVGTSSVFPPVAEKVGTLRPFHGLMVPNYDENDRRSSAVLMGLQLDRPGKATFKRVEIDYRAGSRHYTMKADFRFMACGPLADYPTGCNAEAFFDED